MCRIGHMPPWQGEEHRNVLSSSSRMTKLSSAGLRNCGACSGCSAKVFEFVPASE